MPTPRLPADDVLTVAPKVAGGVLTLVLGLALIAHLDAAEDGRHVFAVSQILLADAVIGTPFDLAVIRLSQARIAADPAGALALGAGAAALLMSPTAAAVPADHAGVPQIFAILLQGMLVAITTSAMALPLVVVARRTFLLRLDLVVAPPAAAGWLPAIPAHGVIGAAVVTLTMTLMRSLGVLAAAWAVTARPARRD